LYTSYSWEERADDFRFIANHLVAEFSPKTALDVGCAKGFLVRALVEAGCDARGVDVSAHAIAESGLADRLDLCDLNQGTLPFDSGSFDLLTCMGTLEYLDDDTDILREFHRVLRPGGVFVWQGLARRLESHPVLVNTRTPSEWRERIQAFGFDFADESSKQLYVEDRGRQIEKLPSSWKATIWRALFHSPLRQPALRLYDKRAEGPTTYLVFRSASS
jgi:SAM-dependent methyltransferase